MKDYKDRNNKDKNNSDLVDFFKELNKANDKIFSKILIRLVKDKQYKLITNLDTDRLNNNYLFTDILIDKIALNQSTLRLSEVLDFIKELGDFGKKLDLSSLIGTHASWFLFDLVDGRTRNFSNFDVNPYKKELNILKKEIDEIVKLRHEGYIAEDYEIKRICLEHHNNGYQYPIRMTPDNIDFVNNLIDLYM